MKTMHVLETLDPYLLQWLELATKTKKISKKRLLEKAIRMLKEKILTQEAKRILKMKFDDLPSDDEWLKIAPIKEWEWKD